jgi:protein TonB
MRYIISIICGLVIAFGLFLLLHTFVSGQPQVNTSQGGNFQLVNFVRVNRHQQVQHKNYHKPKKPKPQKHPPTQVKVSKTKQAHVQTPKINVPNLNTPVGGAGGAGPFLGSGATGTGGAAGPGAEEGDVIPLVQIQPQYPRQALINGLSGAVTLEFTINPDGTVSDPHVVKTTNHIFNNAAREAILKWKFKPRVVNGKAVSRKATETIQFNLSKSQQ